MLALTLSAGALLGAQAPVLQRLAAVARSWRSGLSPETGLLREWPASGPPRVWSTAEPWGRIRIDRRARRSGLRAGHAELAERRLGAQSRGRQARVGTASSAGRVENYQGPGPRGTPTVDGDRLYVLTENGDLACLRVQDGTVVWQRNILQDFGGRNIGWLISESPLVDGNQVVVTPGGRGAGMAALDKMTGKTIWTSKELSDQAGYASPIVADVQGVRTIMTLTSEAGVGVRASDGKLMWRYQAVANDTANIATPVFGDNKVFYTSNYGTGGALLALRAEGGEVRAQEVYFTRDMQNHHGGLVLVNGYLYGFNNSILTCLEFATGKVMWRAPERRQGVAHLRRRAPVPAQREQRRRSRRGDVGRATAKWDASRLPIRAGRSWAHPGRERRAALPAESGYSYRLRHPGELAELVAGSR